MRCESILAISASEASSLTPLLIAQRVDLGDQCRGNALTAEFLLHINAFEKRNRRGIASVDIIPPEADVGKTDGHSDQIIGNETGVVVGKVLQFRPVFGNRGIGP